eukprot:Nitzschia sp. Nitz4//scaffold73_size107353//104613//105565//NITZ4_004336-RA/size107353-snap-gene-0.115-mRNA-1//-1//CDS//3329557524//820//frame0
MQGFGGDGKAALAAYAIKAHTGIEMTGPGKGGDVEEGFQDEQAEGASQRRVSHTLFTTGILSLAGATLAFNVLVMIGYHTYISTVIGSVVAVMVGVTQLRLEDMDTLRFVHNKLRRSVNKMCVQNVRLTESVNRLDGEVSELKGSEEKLSLIAKENESNVKLVVELVKENGRIIQQKKKLLKQDLIAELMDTVMRGERDESGDFSDAEIQRLCRFMRALPAVKVNEELLNQAIQRDRSVWSILTLVGDILREGDQLGDQIFVIDGEDPDLQARFSHS